MSLETQLCDITNLKHWVPQNWQNRRLTANLSASFSKVGKRILLIKMNMTHNTRQSDWEKFFADREIFIENMSLPTGGIIEIWAGDENPILGCSVEVRPMFFKFFRTEIGRLVTWISCHVSPTLHTVFKLKEAPELPFSTHIKGTLDEALDLAKKFDVQRQTWEDQLQTDDYSDTQLWGTCHQTKTQLKLQIFGQCGSGNRDAFFAWIKNFSTAEKQIELDATQLNFMSFPIEKEWQQLIQVFEHLNMVALNVKGESKTPCSHQTITHEIETLLSNDIADLQAKVESLERRISREQRRSEDATLAKSDFLQVINHELRTPLNGIISMMDLILGTNLNKEQKEYATIAEASSSRLLSLITNLLDYAKLDAGQLELNDYEFDLENLIRGCIERVEIQAHKKSIQVQQNSITLPYAVRGDRERISQMIMELINNSLRYTDQGTIVVGMSRLSETESHITLKIDISDTGCGLPKDKMDLIFHDFSQMDSVATRPFGGSGLGLSLCRKLAACMGGRMGVSSVEGEGSHFWFSLKLSKCQERTQPQKTFDDILAQLQGGHVLVADDNAISRRVLVKELLGLGFDVDVTGSGLSALELVNHQPFDLIFIDLYMPEMDGYEVASRIQEAANCTASQAPLMLGLSRRMHPEILCRSLESGMKGVLNKPLDSEKLKGLLVQCYEEGWRLKSPINNDR